MQLVFTILAVIALTVVLYEVIGDGTGTPRQKAKAKLKRESPCLKDEQTMAIKNFRKEFVDLSDLIALIRADKLSDGTLFALQKFINTYSLEGFKRHISHELYASVAEKEAAVLVCLIIDVPYPLLWKNLFMTENEARKYMDLVGA